MKIYILKIAMVLAVTLAPVQNITLGQYSDYRSLSAKFQALANDYPSLCTLKSLVKTDGGKDVWLLTIGKGEKDSKPGVAVIGGIDGRYLAGRELAAGFAENILKNSSVAEISALLDKVTFYVLPDVSPDASAQYFSALKYERAVNSRNTDDDRDFSFGEDPFEDLNGDGYITLVRVEDPAGTFVESDEDKRIMVPADLSKGQKGMYVVVTEGVDNDKDDQFNEDGEGGVSFNNNFTFNYEEFGKNAGMHPVSEPETWAVAGFLFDMYNIFMTFSFGPEDNLGQPMKASERAGQGRKVTSILKTDEIINKLVSEKYHEITKAKGAPLSVPSPGNFMEWSYFHYGRYSFSTPGWWFPFEKGKNNEAAFLKFAGRKNIENTFISWTAVDHPDFPGKKAEVGGLKPFMCFNPPADTLEALIESHYRFITAVSSMHPDLQLTEIKTEEIGNNVFRLSLKVVNRGILATGAEIGEQNIWTRIMRIKAEPATGQAIISGAGVQRVPRLQGNESADFSWLITGRGAVKITAGSAGAGTVSTIVELK